MSGLAATGAPQSSAHTHAHTHTALGSHGSLKDVYDQMENIKIHFESQLEQLNRELQVA